MNNINGTQPSKKEAQPFPIFSKLLFCRKHSASLFFLSQQIFLVHKKSEAELTEKS